MPGVPGTRLTAYMSAHVDSPLQQSYDPGVEKAYVDHAETFRENVLGHGTTMSPTPGTDPLPVEEHEWYAVGGATDPRTGTRHGERSYNLSHASPQFTNSHALEHILRTEGMNIDRAAGRTPGGQRWPAAYAGGWNETTEDGQMAVLDYTDVYAGKRGKRQAVAKGIERGERAIFDAKNVRDINLPQAGA